MRSVEELLALSTKYLSDRGVERARREAEEILSGALRLKRLDLYLQFDRPLEPVEVGRCREALRRRGEREPSQYIFGQVDFFGCDIAVGPGVLIPRPETEQLVDRVAPHVSSGRLLDLCCGSGCIGIALAKRHPELKVTLADISPVAIERAQANAERNGVEVALACGDLVGPIKGEKFDWVVCNPPYIAAWEFDGLQAEVRNWEPREALISGPTGLEIYERLAHDLPEILVEGGRLWLEIGKSQGEGVTKIFSNRPWSSGEVATDWSGQNRFFSVEFEPSKGYPYSHLECFDV